MVDANHYINYVSQIHTCHFLHQQVLQTCDDVAPRNKRKECTPESANFLSTFSNTSIHSFLHQISLTSTIYIPCKTSLIQNLVNTILLGHPPLTHNPISLAPYPIQPPFPFPDLPPSHPHPPPSLSVSLPASPSLCARARARVHSKNPNLKP